jgi:general secretion pathway protein E
MFLWNKKASEPQSPKANRLTLKSGLHKSGAREIHEGANLSRESPVFAPVPPKFAPPPSLFVPVPDGEDHDDVIRTFAGVPKFEGVLTAGPNPAYPIESKDRHKYIALECTGRRSVVLIAEGIDRNHSEVVAMVGAISAKRFSAKVMIASADLIRDIYATHLSEQPVSDVSDTKFGPKKVVNPYMEEASRWIAFAVKQGATDIHLEIKGSKGFVRLRVDGEVEPLGFDNGGVYPAAFIEKTMATLYNNEQQRKSGSDSNFEANKSLYCMVPFSEIPGHSLKLRLQTLPGSEGPKCVLRLLSVEESVNTLTYEELGYEETQIQMWETASYTPSGGVVIAGVTGSGKSTTQKSFIELHPSLEKMAVFTIEDPVEYPIKRAHQIPLQRDLSNPEESARIYSATISGLMRSDPDLVMLGEVRDRPSGTGLQQLVETGHAALCTVHAHFLSGIAPRLTNDQIGLSRQVITGPNMLTLLVYQALVPKLCPHCALSTSEAEGTDKAIDMLLAGIRRLGLDTASFKWKRPGGCDHCDHRGTKGLTIVAEMHMPDGEWLQHTRNGRDDLAVESYRATSDLDLTSSNMLGKTVFEHTLLKAYRGVTDARQCNRFDNLALYIQRNLKMRNKSINTA